MNRSGLATSCLLIFLAFWRPVPHTLIGAIRWDAWIGPAGKGLVDASSVGLQVERSLNPHRYHYRAPFYSREIGPDSIQCRGTTQAIMDREIAYAKDAGIDYWAFCWYPNHTGLDTARQLYLASRHREDIKWCLILGTNPFDFRTDAKWLVERFKEPAYQKVLDGRPLVYIFNGLGRKQLDSLRTLCVASGVKDPYVALMGGDVKNVTAVADSLHADALSAYISWTGENGDPYAKVIPAADSTGWEHFQATGKPVIPWVTTGHNTKPRIDHPVSWTTVPANQWVADGSPAEIGAHLRQALQWVRDHPAATEANAVLLYAWNEFDEGGWICPTLGDNRSRLDGIKAAIKTAPTPITYAVEQWRALEITLTSTKTYSDPFAQVAIDAVFTGPQGVTIKRPAFWDGGNTWKIRFAPPQTGSWSLVTTASDTTDTSLHHFRASISCRPYTGSLAIYKHGFLKISNDHRYFTYADGTPFFYLGDTHWLYIHERFSTSNVKGVLSEFKYLVDKRVGQGFTVYQSEAIQHPHGANGNGADHIGRDEEPACNFRDGMDEKDLPGFANIDRKFRYIADQGLVNANSAICWALDPADYPDVYTESYMSKLGRYWDARYGAYPVLWTIAQEIDKNMYKRYDSVSIRKWYAAAAAIAANDAYHHPLTAHMENTGQTVAADSWWDDKPYHEWWAVQCQSTDEMATIAKGFWNHTPAKPSVLYESPYEDFWTDEKGARGAAYKAFQNGFYGYGYGANGVWNDLYSKDPPDYGTGYEMPFRYESWYEGAQLKGAGQLRYCKNFYSHLPWWKLIPRFDDTTWSSFADVHQSLLSTDGQNIYVVYFFNRVRATGRLRNLLTAVAYSAQWYDPRSGAYISIGQVRSAAGSWTIPSKPDSGDWLLLVRRN